MLDIKVNMGVGSSIAVQGRLKMTYTHNFKGTALYILAEWQYWHDLGVGPTEQNEMIRTGRMYAYSAILQHITGEPPSKVRDSVPGHAWKQAIDSMPGN